MRQEVDFRAVGALTGDVAASPVGKILDSADEISSELDRLRRDNVKLAEIADGLACAVDRLSDERDEALVRAQELAAENADLAERLDSLDNAHQITLSQLARVRDERDTCRVTAVTR